MRARPLARSDVALSLGARLVANSSSLVAVSGEPPRRHSCCGGKCAPFSCESTQASPEGWLTRAKLTLSRLLDPKG